MKSELSETQARLLADQLYRVWRKKRAAQEPLSYVYDFGVKAMLSAGRQLGYDFTITEGGAAWQRVGSAVTRGASEADRVHTPDPVGSTPAPATSTDPLVEESRV